MQQASPTNRLRRFLLCALALLCTNAAAERPRVALAEVERTPFIEEIALNGTVTALQRSHVSVAVSGLVLERHVDTGDRVERGDLLLRLDDELARLERDRAAAEAHEAASRLAEARRVAEEARSVRGGRSIAATEVSRRESEAGIAEAALARYRAAEQLEAARLQRHRIVAPISGIVSERAVETGQWVEPGVPVFTLVNPDALLIDFQVPQQAMATLDDASELILEGPDGTSGKAAEIASWLPVTDPSARTFLLRAKPPAEFLLVPGMAVSATLRLVRRDEALAVSRDAVNRYPEGRTTVWIAEPAEDAGAFTVREQRIAIIGTAGDQVFVGEGLSGSERVVSRGNESLRDGAEVMLAERE